jgi:hypothetical protein
LRLLDNIFKTTATKPRPNFAGPQVFIAASLVLGTVFAAAIYLGPGIELGAGVEETDTCAETPVVSFGQDFVTNMSGNPSRITSVTVEGIPVACAGRYFRLNLFDSQDELLESIVWQSALVSNTDTAIQAVADGTTTVNRSESGNSIIYPANEQNPLGLVLESIDPEEIDSFLLESSETALQEED